MIIIKVGGGKKINWDYISEDLKEISEKEKVILVHGASELRDEIADKLGHPTQTVVSPSGISSVYTDQESLDIFLMAYAGVSNKKIVAVLQSFGLNAVGFSGVDGRIWEAKAKPNLMIKEGSKTKLVRDNKTGRVEKVNAGLLRLLVENNYIPVLSAPAISFESKIVNTDNDTAVAFMAQAIGADKIVYLFEAPGLLRDIHDESSAIKKIGRAQIDNCMKFAKGRMKKKLLATKNAIESGVKTVYFADGRIKNPVLKALSGVGTIINR